MSRSYGVTFWFPSYIDQLTQNKQATPTNAACNGTLANITHLPSDNYLCQCPLTHYNNVTVHREMIDRWWVWNTTFINTSLLNGRYERVWFESVIWREVLVRNVTFDQMIFYNSTWTSVTIINVTFNNSILCDISVDVKSLSLRSVQFINTLINGQMMRDSPHNLVQDLFNSSTYNDTYCLTNMTIPSCMEDSISPVDYNTEYFHDFIITASSLVGIITSSIAVYFLIRSFWLGMYPLLFYRSIVTSIYPFSILIGSVCCICFLTIYCTY